MKVIDLLNKIANGEEVPKKIKYKGIVREFDYEDKDYTCLDNEDYYLFLDILAAGTGDKMVTGLNDEIEVIEDTPKEDKKIEKFKIIKDNSGDSVELIYDGMKLELTLLQAIILDKINEIIDKINGE